MLASSYRSTELPRVPEPADLDEILIEQLAFLLTVRRDARTSVLDLYRLNEVSRLLLGRFDTSRRHPKRHLLAKAA